MTEAKLTDFTSKELDTLLEAVAGYQVHLPKCQSQERENIELWVTQLIAAKVQVKLRETVQSN